MPDPQKIQPRATEVSTPYWQGCAQNELRLQFCELCSAYQFYPRIMCSSCGSTDLRWRAVSGDGKIASYTIVRRGVSAAYDAPYVVALVDLAEGPRMMSQISMENVDDERLRVGAEVSAIYQPWSEETTVVLFELA